MLSRCWAGIGALRLLWVLGTVCAFAVDVSAQACSPAERTLRFGFYAHFEPVSYSADPDPASPGIDMHRGYDADLLTALEAMEGADLSFTRRGIAAWDGIWLLPSGPRYDIVGGGITIIESRTRAADGGREIVFTAGHIEFRQSLLVRAADAERLARHRDLTGADRVGVLAGTTGEARFLELTGITASGGVLAADTRVETGEVVVADGSADYVITAVGTSPDLSDRLRLRPVIYFTDEAAMIEALAGGGVDAVAGGEVGNLDAARTQGGAFAVTAHDSRVEVGGFALATEDAELAACLDRHVAWLTEGGRIGYREWLDAPVIFMRRAGQWPVAE